MSVTGGNVVSATAPTGQVVDPKTGFATPFFQKWLQGIGATINNAFDQQSNLTPNAVPAPTPTSLGGVNSVVGQSGKFVSAITTAGVLELTQPAFSDLSGTASGSQVPPLAQLSGSVTAGQVPQLSQLNGKVTPSQVPDLSTLNGSVTSAQVPPLSDLSGRITEAQLPSAGISVTITTAALTGGGSTGSMTFTNGILTGQVQAT